MTAEEIHKFCLSLPGTTEQIQWRTDLVFKIAGKMYACLGTEGGSGFSFKCPEDSFYELTELPGVRPAPYLARAHWVAIDPEKCPIADSRMEELVRRSYALVVAKLPKKTQRAILSDKD